MKRSGGDGEAGGREEGWLFTGSGGGMCRWRFVSFRLGKRGAAGLSQSGGLLERRSAFLREEDRVDHGCVCSL